MLIVELSFEGSPLLLLRDILPLKGEVGAQFCKVVIKPSVIPTIVIPALSGDPDLFEVFWELQIFGGCKK